MKPIFRLTAIVALLLISVAVQAQRRNSRYNEYIKQYAPLAVEQMREHRIPASITLAQGLLESGAGQSTLARKSNNHFGIKCGSNWRGRSVRHDDDARNECFRAYRNPKDSYEDHSLFLKRGGFLTALPGEPPFNSVPLGRVRIGWSKYTPPLVLVRR